MRGVLPLLLASLALASGAAMAAEDPLTRSRQLYDMQRYTEALPLLQQLDSEGKLDGPGLYRLYYCQNLTRDTEASNTLTRAKARLEDEFADKGSAETAFYLTNIYARMGRPGEVKRVAGEATAKVADGTWPAPTSGIGMFQLGKMYEDQSQPEPASEWYKKALDTLEKETGKASPYSLHAARFLAGSAYDSGDFSGAADYYAVLAEGPQASFDDLDRLARSRIKLGDYAGASLAWRKAIPLDPPRANGARYSGQLADRANELGTLPTSTPDGQVIKDLPRPDLEQAILDQAINAKQALGEAHQAKSLSDAEYEALSIRVQRAKSVFVAAALEYAMRGLPLRETAFRAGYATLIFRPGDWAMPLRVPQESRGATEELVSGLSGKADGSTTELIDKISGVLVDQVFLSVERKYGGRPMVDEYEPLTVHFARPRWDPEHQSIQRGGKTYELDLIVHHKKVRTQDEPANAEEESITEYQFRIVSGLIIAAGSIALDGHEVSYVSGSLSAASRDQFNFSEEAHLKVDGKDYVWVDGGWRTR